MKNSVEEGGVADYPSIVSELMENNKEINELQRRNTELLAMLLSDGVLRGYIVETVRRDMQDNGEQFC